MKTYRWLLRLFPREFRRRFGEDMVEVFTDRRRLAHTRGAGAVIALWVRTVVDTAAHGYQERRSERTRSRKRGRMAAIVDDARAGIRSLARRPASSALAVGMLALGLGFNTALFAVVHAVLLRPLPYDDPDRVMMLWTGRNADGSGGVNSYADFAEWQTANTSFSSLAAYNISFAALTGDGDPEEVNGSVVSPEFFGVLRVPMLHGRGLEPGDELVGIDGGRPIVISHSLWQRRFSSDPAVIGRLITLGDRPRRVVGVVSPEFEHPEPFFGARAEYWSPLTVGGDMRTNHGARFLRVIGRLNDDVTLERARADLDAIGQRLIQSYPDTHEQSVVLGPIKTELSGDAGPLALVFLCATALVLCLAVANIVNLLLARLSGRRTELAIRAALGAGRARLVSGIVTESVVLGLAGGFAGLGCAALGINLVLAFGPGHLPGIEKTTLNAPVVLFSLALSVLAGLLCGLAPALRVGRERLSSSLGDMRGSTGPEASRLRVLLVAAEMALAVPLLIGAGLLTSTLVSLQRVDAGFAADHALQFRVSMPPVRYSSTPARTEFLSRALARLRALPGVTATGAVSSLPFGGLNNTGGGIVYERVDGTLAETGVGTRVVAGEYFESMRIPLKKGRFFEASNADAEAVIVNDRAAAALWGDADPIGRRLRFGQRADPPDQIRWLTVVGVVGSVRHEALDRPANAEVFQPYVANAWSTMMITVRTDGDTAALPPVITSVMRDLDAAMPLVNMGPVSRFVEGQLSRSRFGVLCAIVFGALGLALAAGGTFAVLSLLVSQRRREIGIRMALGATPRSVASLVVRQSMRPALVGCLAGALLAAWLGRFIEGRLFAVSATDFRIFTAGVGLLALVALAASWLPARRAMRTDPVVTLRD